MSERDRTRSTVRAASTKSAEATPESHVPRCRARVDTILPFCAGRLSWRHRARPSATLHETQACPLGANLNDSFLSQRVFRRKHPCSEWSQNDPQWLTPAPKGADLRNWNSPFCVYTKTGGHSEPTGPRTFFSSGVVSRRTCICPFERLATYISDKTLELAAQIRF
jgi:hypothetical protein